MNQPKATITHPFWIALILVSTLNFPPITASNSPQNPELPCEESKLVESRSSRVIRCVLRSWRFRGKDLMAELLVRAKLHGVDFSLAVEFGCALGSLFSSCYADLGLDELPRVQSEVVKLICV
ncbi:hypothetical protein Droror1_Dr00018248 [Drosera rotundifolia]